MHGRLVDEVPVLRLAVVAEALAVVAHDDHGDRPPRPGFERRDQPPQLLVHRRDLAQVGSSGVAAPEGLGGRVGRVRVEVVDPEKDEPARLPLQVGDRAVGRLRGRALDLPARQLVVVEREPAGETEASGQDEAGDEGGRAVPGPPEPLGQDRVIGGEGAGVLVDAVPGGIEARHHGGVRGKRLRRGRVGLAEEPAPRREGVERRRLDASRLGTDRVGARRVERDEQDRGAHGGRGRRPGLLLAGARAAPTVSAPARATNAAFVLGLRIRALLQTVPEGMMPRAERCWSG